MYGGMGLVYVYVLYICIGIPEDLDFFPATPLDLLGAF